MVAHPDLDRPWPRRRLHGFILLCFLAQVVFIIVFGPPRVSPLKPPPFATGVYLVSDPWSMEQLAAFSELSDPSVFALPSLEGFSRAGWLTYKPVPDDFAEAPQEARWLQLQPGSLGRDFATYVASNSPAPIRVGDASMPELVGLQPRTSSELEFPKSQLRILGSLAQRKLLTPLDLPPWQHTDVLTNSVVHLLVDGEGTPLSSALISGSGSKQADNYALAAAKRLRFKPTRERDAVTSGTLSFLWQTLPRTNLSPGLTLP